MLTEKSNNPTNFEMFNKKTDDLDFKKILGEFIQQWKLYLACLIFFIFLAFIYVHYSTPLYKVNSQVLVQDGDNTSNNTSFLNTDMLTDFGGMLGSQTNVNNELAIVQTKDLLEKVINQMNLNITYFRKGDIRNVELYDKSPFRAYYLAVGDSLLPVTYEVKLDLSKDGETIELSKGDSSFKAKFDDTLNIREGKLCLSKTGVPFQDEVYLLTLNSVNTILSSTRDNLLIELPSKDNTVISLTYNTTVPRKGEDILKNLINAYLNRNLNEKNQMSDSTIKFINSRIDIVSRELGGIEENIQEFKQSNKITDLEEQSKVLINNSSDYYTKLKEIEVQVDITKTMLHYIREDENNSRPVPFLSSYDGAFLALAQQYNTLLTQKSQMKLAANENNPVIQNINTQIDNLRRDILKSLQNQQKALEISRSNLQNENKLLGNLVYNVPKQERMFVDMSRERDVKQALYLYLLQKKEETAITKASNISNASVIERPRVDVQPYFPSKPIIFSICIFLGMLLPTAGLIVRRIVNNRILTKNDITDNSTVPILAEIGHSEKQGLLSMELEGRSVIAEHFRAFRTNMDFVTSGQKTPHILITSSMTGEGKSFVASNLGSLYAYSGKKVLLMEMDLRKPKLSSMLNMDNSIGFSNFIISNKPYADFIKKVAGVDNLYLMSSGPIPPNPAELLLSEKLDTFFSQIDQEYDIVIIDSPPIGAVTDSQILAKYSHVNLYIVRQRYSFKYNLEIVNELVEQKRMSHMFIVVNDVKKGSSYRYGYGYGYGGYGYGYGENEKKSKLKWFGSKN